MANVNEMGRRCHGVLSSGSLPARTGIWREQVGEVAGGRGCEERIVRKGEADRQTETGGKEGRREGGRKGGEGKEEREEGEKDSG